MGLSTQITFPREQIETRQAARDWCIVSFRRSARVGEPMRKRQRSIAPWVLLFVGIILLCSAVIGAVVFASKQGLLSRAQQNEVEYWTARAIALVPDEEFRSRLIWLGGIAFSAVTAAITFLATWHFLEMNLPRRIEDLKDFHSDDHLALRPQLLTIARNRLRLIPRDLETSRVTLLRRWWSAMSLKERARVLAATASRLGDEARALASATSEAQHKAITAYLVRGYQYAALGDQENAFKEFESATKVKDNDLLSRDIAAGWARCINKQTRELELLQEIEEVAGNARLYIDQARALRRQVELIARRNNDPAYGEALERLRRAQNILRNLVADKEAKLELGRVHTLFCEVRCDRGRPGHLNGPNQPLTRMREYMAGVAMHRRLEEPCGEDYGDERALKVEQRVEALLGDDPPAEDGSDDMSSALPSSIGQTPHAQPIARPAASAPADVTPALKREEMTSVPDDPAPPLSAPCGAA
jgi:tetratricopeptide (TPR) repeat protein